LACCRCRGAPFPPAEGGDLNEFRGIDFCEIEDWLLSGADALLPGALGLKTALDCLTQARYGIAWGVLGASITGHEAFR